MVSGELSAKEGIDSHLVIGSIERDNNGVFIIDQGKQHGPVLGHRGEGFKHKHVSIWERKLKIMWIDRCHGIGWHKESKFEVLQVPNHNGFGIRADQGVAPETWGGLGSKIYPQTSGHKEDQWPEQVGQPSKQQDIPPFEISSIYQAFDINF
uniref:Uncharacterized protein n=1 Tax=Romanomermis culicivorax TaxID=13658 RepID=A0A915KJC0_ROMCU